MGNGRMRSETAARCEGGKEDDNLYVSPKTEPTWLLECPDGCSSWGWSRYRRINAGSGDASRQKTDLYSFCPDDDAQERQIALVIHSESHMKPAKTNVSSSLLPSRRSFQRTSDEQRNMLDQSQEREGGVHTLSMQQRALTEVEGDNTDTDAQASILRVRFTNIPTLPTHRHDFLDRVLLRRA